MSGGSERKRGWPERKHDGRRGGRAGEAGRTNELQVRLFFATAELFERGGGGGVPRFWARTRGGEGLRAGSTVAEERRVNTAKLFSCYINTRMYSNARLSNPSSPLKAPRSAAVDQFEVGGRTHSPAYTTFPRPLSSPVTARRLSSCSMPP